MEPLRPRPIAPTTVAAAATQVGSVVQGQPAVLLASVQGTNRFRIPTPSGFPEPSILVGMPAPADGGVAEAPAALPGAEIAYDDVAGRNALRDSNPELFASLVSSGAFDPPEDQLVRALQTELQRMGCYRGGIDGDWGRGSRRAVTLYVQTAGVEVPTQDAVPDLFRAIVSRPDVACPAPVVAAPRPAAQPAAAPRPAAQPARPPAPQPAQPASRPQIDPTASGIGVFR